MPTSPALSMTLSELVASVNSLLPDETLAVNARTLRSWRERRLLSAPDGTGKGARWGWRHILEACAIRMAQADGVALADIAVAELDSAELAELTGIRADTPDGWQPPEQNPDPLANYWDLPQPEPAAESRPVTSVLAEVSDGVFVRVSTDMAADPVVLAQLAQAAAQLTYVIRYHSQEGPHS